MEDLQKIRFLTANYASLQGLRMIPFSLLALLVSWWVNSLVGPARDLTLPLVFVGLCILLYLGIDRYYVHAYGRVQRKPGENRVEILEYLLGSVFALVAFELDIRQALPVSTLGLIFGLGLIVDYIRLTWRVKGRYLLFYPVLAVLVIGISLLPLVTVEQWWIVVGFHSGVYGVLALIGLVGIIAGLFSHFYLIQVLAPLKEGIDEQSL